MNLSSLRWLWRNLFHRHAVEHDLDQELTSYLELATAEKIKKGMPEAKARREALLDLQGAEQVKEHVRAARRGYRIELILQNLRYALRSLRHAPVFSFTVIVVLALGIGSTTLIFAIVNSVLFEGPPFPQAEQLFTIWQRIPEEPRVSFSPKEFEAWQKQDQVFESLGFVTGHGFTLSGRGDPELVIGRMVTPNFFQVLRANPVLGRAFTEADANQNVVVLSHALWRDKFGSSAEVVGQTVEMNSHPYTIVGVLPERFEFDGPDAKLFVPVNLANPLFQAAPDAHFLRTIGRLRRGITREQLEAEVNVLGSRVKSAADQTDRRFYVLSLKELTTGELRTPLLILLAAVVFLLAIACANVANLTLARVSARRSEIALRAALGASRARLILQLFTESALLAALGGVIGAGIAIWGIDLLRGFAAQNVPELLRTYVDARALIFAFGISAVSSLFFGIGPAVSSSAAALQTALKGATRNVSAADRTRQILVFAEVALAVLLLIGCALMMRSFSALMHVDPGFRVEETVTADLVLMKERYPEATDILRFYRQALEGVRNLPDAKAVGVVTHLPFGGNSWGNSFEIEGRSAPSGGDYSAQIRPVSPDYFSALGIPLKQGRTFTEHDSENAPGVAIVNELLARRFWPTESALGKRIRYSDDWLTIIGVCGNIKHAQLDGSSDMEIYASYPQVPAAIMKFVGRNLNFVVHSGSPGLASHEIRQALQNLDPQNVMRINTMGALVHESTARPRFRTWLIGIFSGFALVLACLGIYGVIAYLVTQRYREIGIRIALGATRLNILRLILGRTFRLAALGVIAGTVAAFFLARFLAHILFQITPHDLLTFTAVPLSLVVIAMLAGYFPASRATRIDPVASLRYE